MILTQYNFSHIFRHELQYAAYLVDNFHPGPVGSYLALYRTSFNLSYLMISLRQDFPALALQSGNVIGCGKIQAVARVMREEVSQVQGE